MSRSMRALLAVALMGMAVSQAHASLWLDNGVPVVSNDKTELDIYGRGQMIGVAENVPDPKADHNRVYLFMKEARLGFKGRVDELFKYDLEFAYGGEDSNGSNTDLGLLNFVADVPIKQLGENTVFKIGQFRVPYSREGLTDEGYMDFGDRSIANLAQYQGRDYGIALMDTRGSWTGTVGTFSSGGRDVPQRYLPERIGIPEVVARFGYNDGVDNDIYHVMGTDRNLTRTTKAFMLNGLYTLDTRIGHSTALNLRTTDKNLLLDPNFNQFINRGDGNVVCSALSCERGTYWAVGGDAVIRHPLGNGQAVEGEAEANWSGYQNRFGVVHIASARAQGDYQTGPWELGVRYGLLSMDSKAGYVSTSATASGATAGSPIKQTVNAKLGVPIHEITPGITYHVRGHNMKVVADLPVYLNCPLWIDSTDGAYAMPDPTSTGQDTVLATAGNNTVRRTVTEARMMFQFQF